MIRPTSSWSSWRLEMIYRTGIFHNTMHAMPAQASIIGCSLKYIKKDKSPDVNTEHASLLIVSSVTHSVNELKWLRVTVAAL